MNTILGTVKCLDTKGLSTLTVGNTYFFTDEGTYFYIVIDESGAQNCVSKDIFELVEKYETPRTINPNSGLPSYVMELESFVSDVKEGKISHYVITGIGVDGSGFIASSTQVGIAKSLLADALAVLEKESEDIQEGPQAEESVLAEVTPLAVAPEEVPVEEVEAEVVSEAVNAVVAPAPIVEAPVTIEVAPVEAVVEAPAEDINSVTVTEESEDEGEIVSNETIEDSAVQGE